jgi:hypothetical protein
MERFSSKKIDFPNCCFGDRLFCAVDISAKHKKTPKAKPIGESLKKTFLFILPPLLLIHSIGYWSCFHYQVNPCQLVERNEDKKKQ